LGGVWQQAAEHIAALLDSGSRDGHRLTKILELGYFSQFTSYPSPEFNDAVATLLEKYLTQHFHVEIDSLPDDLVELDIVPAATIVNRDNRKLSPDLLRYVAYAMRLRKALPPYGERKLNILEVGSGYGGFARTLRCFHPGTCFWLADIPESLRCAEIYLREAFPDAVIAWKVGAGETAPEADFCLVPVADASQVLTGRHFDLAINVWSFGEMPNAFVDAWLKLIQTDCQTTWLFTINSFMAPVTPASVARTEVGDWLFGLDDHWAIEHFEIDPEVHRCPLIRNFPKGIGLLAKRVTDESALSKMREHATHEAKVVMQEDWVGIAIDERTTSSPERPERMLDQSGIEFDGTVISSRRLVTLTDYIGHFNIESGIESAFFRLWNDYRMNRSELSGSLLIAYLAMVGKSDLERRCTKEELLLLNRLPPLPLHPEYLAFGVTRKRGRVSHEGAWLTDQEACDRALEHKKVGEFDAAEALWTKVAAAYPAHGDCWFQLALLYELRSDWPWAAVFAAHSVRLGCDYYVEPAARMNAAFIASLPDTELDKSLLSRWLPRRERIKVTEMVADDVTPTLTHLCRQYFSGSEKIALAGLAQLRRDSCDEVGAQALVGAAALYL
jgi:hypothetical protein